MRLNVASDANVKRSASAPNDGMPFGKLLARALRDRLGLPRVHHVAACAWSTSVSSVDAVDQVERIEHVALRLRHLLAFLVADDGVDVDVAERHAAGEVGRRHDHARDPEEDDVEAGDQHRRRQERARARASPRASRASNGTTARTRTTCRARPRRCANDCGLAAELRARLRARVGFVARDVDVARVVVPRRNLMAPPELARDAPVLDVVDPVEVRRQPLGRARSARVSPSPGAPVGKPVARPPRGTGPGSTCRESTDATPAPACVIATNHWSVSIGSTTSPVRSQRGTTIVCAFSRRRAVRRRRDPRAPPCAPRSDRGRDTSPARCR